MHAYRKAVQYIVLQFRWFHVIYSTEANFPNCCISTRKCVTLYPTYPTSLSSSTSISTFTLFLWVSLSNHNVSTHSLYHRNYVLTRYGVVGPTCLPVQRIIINSWTRIPVDRTNPWLIKMIDGTLKAFISMARRRKQNRSSSFLV